jgi:glycosyltransferase involved in cell wall biosynthesis
MKIALFVHCFFPAHFYGTEAYTFHLARHYQALGHQVTVVSAVFQGEPTAGELVTRYEYEGIPVVCIDKNLIPHSRVGETYHQPEMRGVLEGVLRQLRPDVVHVTHLINHTAALLDVTQQLGIPAYASFTDFFGFCLNNKLEAANGELCAGPSPTRTNCIACHVKDVTRSQSASSWGRRGTELVGAHAVASVARWARHSPGLRGGALDQAIDDIVQRPQLLVELYNKAYTAAVSPTKFLRSAYEANGIRVPMHNIWFGVDIDRSPKPKRSRDHVPVIGFIGQIAPHKGTDLLVEAFRRLPARSAELHVYGPQDQDRAYMERLRALATGYDVKFLGTFPKEREADILRAMDVLVIPSRWYENSPLVLLSALASHTPVVVSDVAGLTEFIKPGVNGRAFQRGSADSLHEVLVQMLSDRETLEALSQTTSFERGTKAMAQDTLDIYAVN